MRLSKHHGLGNDFLIFLDPARALDTTSAFVRAVCDRHRGIGADGFIRVTGGDSIAGVATDVTMHLFNADGTRAEMSGNGVSCVAQAAVLAGLATAPTVTVATDAGIRTIEVELASLPRTHWATVDMGVPVIGDDAPEWLGDSVLRAIHVDMGNPHLVLHVAEGASAIDLEALGRRVNEVVPGGSNVELITSGPGVDELTMRVYERGVGVTDACGTGASAAAAAALIWDLAGKQVLVHQPGGTAEVDLGATIKLTLPVVHVANIDFPL